MDYIREKNKQKYEILLISIIQAGMDKSSEKSFKLENEFAKPDKKPAPGEKKNFIRLNYSRSEKTYTSYIDTLCNVSYLQSHLNFRLSFLIEIKNLELNFCLSFLIEIKNLE